jgi:pyrimidine deaminase RibD-like protein
MISQRDTELLRQAVELADLSPQNAASFSVGALIAAQDGRVLATGYTREFGENWHAEEVAIEKARQSGIDLAGRVLYSSLEPCGQRLSGRTCCAEHIIRAGISRVIYCLGEPPIFVHPRGHRLLAQAGVSVERDDRFADGVLRNNVQALSVQALSAKRSR